MASGCGDIAGAQVAEPLGVCVDLGFLGRLWGAGKAPAGKSQNRERPCCDHRELSDACAEATGVPPRWSPCGPPAVLLGVRIAVAGGAAGLHCPLPAWHRAGRPVGSTAALLSWQTADCAAVPAGFGHTWCHTRVACRAPCRSCEQWRYRLGGKVWKRSARSPKTSVCSRPLSTAAMGAGWRSPLPGGGARGAALTARRGPRQLPRGLPHSWTTAGGDELRRQTCASRRAALAGHCW